MKHYFTINGKDSRDFDCYLARSNMLDAPSRDYELISIPGRNGELVVDNGRFKNFSAKLTVYFRKDVVKAASAFKAYLMSINGYMRYEESTDREVFRLVKVESGFDMSSFDRAGGYAELSLTCMPQKWLKTGERVMPVTSGMILYNPTNYAAKPLITVKGTGELSVGNTKVSCSESMTIDCENADCYDGSRNENPYVTLNGADFPELKPGDNGISFTGFSEVTIKPNWWTI